ncbi:oxidoreductase domain-containing protein [Venturia nashicola]|uniref:Oxidoreductase domain-containing protein n=1 Tax=Venturia nashicola TaxID=86259 RepID=A0A4Z1PS52_9PEZI|nr:oxidoreductase domain-containing protein [Venturia nashicola]
MASQTSTSASALAPLPTDFLVGPPKDLAPRISKIDFAETELPEYAGLYAIVIDNIFTIQECEELVCLAEAQTNGKGWERAMVNIGGGRQAMYEDTRKCGRIIFDSPELASRMWERVAPLIPEILRLEGEPQVMGWGPVKRGEVWKCVGLNERLRFLKYVGGEFFKAHCDGCYEAPTKERSYYTLHLYLNDTEHQPSHSESNSEPLVGGATTFFGDTMRTRLDVEPKIGRVLVFQQRGLLHAGDDVVSGVKLTLRTDVMYEKSGEVAENREVVKDMAKKQPAWVNRKS